MEKLTWSFITDYISSKSSNKKGLTIPFDKFNIYNLNIYYTKWIDKSILPKYIRNTIKGDDFYIAWLDGDVFGNTFIYKERKSDFEIEFKKYISHLISKYRNKVEINESLLNLNSTLQDIDSSNSILGGIFVENKSNLKTQDELESQNLENSTKVYENLIGTNRLSKLSEVYLHEKILNKILDKGDFNEVKYLTLNPNLDWNLQKKLLKNQPEEDNFKLILSRPDVSLEVLMASLKSTRFKKFALLNQSVSTELLNQFVDSISKLTDRDEIKAALKNPNISEVAIRKIFSNLNRQDQKEFIPLLKGKSLAQLEKNNLVKDAFENKYLFNNIISQTSFTESQFNSYIKQYFEQTSDLEDKKLILLGLLQNPYVKLKEIKNFVKDWILNPAHVSYFSTIEKTYFLELLKQYDHKDVKEGIKLFSSNISLEEIEVSINSRETDGIVKTGFSYMTKPNNFIVAINTKWFSLAELDDSIKGRVVKKGKDLYVAWTSSAYFFPGAPVLDSREIIVSEYKDDFILQVKQLAKRVQSEKEIKNKEPKFELKSSVEGKERDINMTDILKSTGYFFNFNDKANLFSNQEALTLENTESYFIKTNRFIKTIEDEIEGVKKGLMDYFALSKNRSLEPQQELNTFSRTDSGGFYLNYPLNGEDIEYIRGKMKVEDFEKVFNISYGIDSDILKGIIKLNPSIKESLKDYTITRSAYVREKNGIETLTFKGDENQVYKTDIGVELRKEFDPEFKELQDYQNALDSFYLIKSILDKDVKKTLQNFLYAKIATNAIAPVITYKIDSSDTFKFPTKDSLNIVKGEYDKVFELKSKLLNFLKETTNGEFSQELFEMRKTQKIKDQLASFKETLKKSDDLSNLFDLLVEKTFLDKVEFETLIKESVQNTKGLYTLKNLGGYDDLVKEIIKKKKANGDFSLAFDDQRHYIS